MNKYTKDKEVNKFETYLFINLCYIKCSTN